MKYNDFIELPIWNESRKIVKQIYELTENSKLKSDCGFKDQIRRAAVSIMNNIAEGFDSGSNKNFIKFLLYSQASCSEVLSMFYIALDIKYIDDNLFVNLKNEIISLRKQIKGFIKYLRSV